MSEAADRYQELTATPQVERVRAMSEARGWNGRFFPDGHPLARLVPARWSRICEALSVFDINLQFNDSANEDDPRSAFRRSYAKLLGPGMELTMPTAGAFICYPGRNRVLLPKRTDRTLVSYLQRSGFLGEAVFIEGVPEIIARQRNDGRRLYSIDDLGEEGDVIAANSLHDMWVGNSKETVGALSAYAAPELRKDMFEVTDADFEDNWGGPGLRVFVKTCNTEAAGEGIYPVSSLEEFRTALATIRDKTARFDLSRTLVIQPEIVGDNKSFQIFIDPARPDDIPVLALTDQLIAADGKKYLGSINHDLTPERLEVIGPAIIDLADRLKAQCPDAVGFLMCDYFERPDGSVVVYDPGLRPSGNTAAAMVKRWVEEATGEFVGVSNVPWLDFEAPGMLYEEVLRRVGEWGDPDYILENRLGVVPRGHNPIMGKTRFILVTPTREEQDEAKAELERRVRGE